MQTPLWPGRPEAVRPYRERCARRRQSLQTGLDRIVRHCAGLSEVQRVVVFGSFARDRVSPWSDLDVLIVTAGDPRALMEELYRKIGPPGEIVVVRSTDFPERLRMTPFGRTILEQGVEVYAHAAR